MTIQTAAGACEAIGWPGAIGWSAFCLMIAAIAWAIAYGVAKGRAIKEKEE